MTRPSLPWGIPLPEEVQGSEGHTAYVWADALLDYLSALGWPERRYSLWWLAREGDVGGPGAARQDEFQHLDGQGRPGAAWAGTTTPQSTNALHLIGKDISRFHCVLWPALLLAAGVPLPRQVYVHGFIYVRGEKPRSRWATWLDPVDIAERYGSDALRFYLLHAIPTGRDGDPRSISWWSTATRTSRTIWAISPAARSPWCTSTSAAWGPSAWTPEGFRMRRHARRLDALLASAREAQVRVPGASRRSRPTRRCRRPGRRWCAPTSLIERVKPWALAKDDARRDELGTALAALLETLRLVALWTWPAIPGKSED